MESKTVTTLNKHHSAVKGVALSRDRQYLATVDEDGKIILWQQHDRTWQYLKTLQKYNKSIWSVVFSPDSQTLATAGEDGKIILWNLDNIRQLNPLEYGCNWSEDYLQYSIEVARRDRYLCLKSRHRFLKRRNCQSIRFVG